VGAQGAGCREAGGPGANDGDVEVVVDGHGWSEPRLAQACSRAGLAPVGPQSNRDAVTSVEDHLAASMALN
jgi:hypothetical protein